MLAQGRFWRAALSKDGVIAIGVLRDGLSEDLRELREFRFEVPIEKWNRVLIPALFLILVMIHDRRHQLFGQLPFFKQSCSQRCMIATKLLLLQLEEFRPVINRFE